MTTLDTILAILTAMFGAGNIWQFFTVRSLRRVKAAEADQANIETLNLVIDSWRSSYDNLQSRYDKLQDKYDKLVEKYDSLQIQLSELRQLIGK